MEELEKEFVPYDRALRLKALGFDQPCLAAYSEDEDTSNLFIYWNDLANMSELFISQNNCEKFDYKCLAPTFSAVFKWFRERGYNFNLVNDSSQVDGDYFYDVWFNGKFLFESDYIYKTYEEAELACLDKLIEICSSK